MSTAEKAKTRQKEAYEATLTEKEAIIKELKNQLAHVAAVVERNGTNTGIPTSATPINKKKTYRTPEGAATSPGVDSRGVKGTPCLVSMKTRSQTGRNMNWICLMKPVFPARGRFLIQEKQNIKTNSTLRSQS